MSRPSWCSGSQSPCGSCPAVGRWPGWRPAGSWSSGTYYYLHDALQSIVAVTDANGAVVNSYSYDPFGNAVATSEQVSNPFRWIGAVWDSGIQMYKMGARYYAPALGRFTQLDPGCQSLDGYVYSADDPINKSDPTGYYWYQTCGWQWSCGWWWSWWWGWVYSCWWQWNCWWQWAAQRTCLRAYVACLWCAGANPQIGGCCWQCYASCAAGPDICNDGDCWGCWNRNP